MPIGKNGWPRGASPWGSIETADGAGDLTGGNRGNGEKTEENEEVHRNAGGSGVANNRVLERNSLKRRKTTPELTANAA